MTSTVDEKRADERRIKELREFQRSNPANKRCFDCNEMMPQYVCLDFNTFVCTSCSGIHREFAHRVKSISMSKFTETELKNMLKFGGNEAAQKIWRARHDSNFRPNGGTEGERTRNFIRLTYIDRKWAYESPRQSLREDRPQKSSGSSKKPSIDSNDASGRTSFDAFNEPNNSGGFASFGDFSNFDSKEESQSTFDDFDKFDSASSATSSQASAGFGDFGSFSSKPAAAPPLQDAFKSGSFNLAPPPGSSFSSAPPAPVPATAASSRSTSTTNDLFAFSPQNSVSTNDPFGFDSPRDAKATTGSSTTGAFATSSPFDAFGDAPKPTQGANATSSLDVFRESSPSSPAFDAFGTATNSNGGSSFGAFGESVAATSDFGDFSASNASKPVSSDPFATTQQSPNVPANPFSAFSPRSSTGVVTSETAKTEPIDPFSAFESISDPSDPPSSASGQHSINPSPYDMFGYTSSPTPQQPPANANSDPFSGIGGGGSMNPSNGANTPFGMQAQAQQLPQHQQPAFGSAFGQQQANPMFHPQQNAHQGQPQMVHMQQHPHLQQPQLGQLGPNGTSQNLQPQQWIDPNGAKFSGYPAFQQMGQFPQMPHSGVSGLSGPHASGPKTADPATLNDPFASLSLGSFGLSSGSKDPTSASSSRTNSYSNTPQSHQQQPPSMGGTTVGYGFPSATMNATTSGSFPNKMPFPGNNSNQSVANAGGSSGSAMSTFGFSSAQTVGSIAPFQTTASQSPAASFSFPAQQTASTTDNSFNAFASFSATPQPDLVPNQPSTTSANPFDMF